MSQKRQAVLSVFNDVYRAILEIAQDEDGVTAIEYGLLAALIVVVAAGSIAALGGGVAGVWNDISVQVSAAL